MIRQESIPETITHIVSVPYCDVCRARIDPGPMLDGKHTDPEPFVSISYVERAKGRGDSNAQSKDVCTRCMNAKVWPLLELVGIRAEQKQPKRK